MLDFAAFFALLGAGAVLLKPQFHKFVERRGIAWTLSVVVSFLVVSVAVLYVSRSRSFQVFGQMVTAMRTKEKLVALTFDDGPTLKYTPQILEMLQREDVKATFFLIGGDLEHEPEAGRMIAARGHEIGNHSFSHERMVFKSEPWIARDIERTDALIRQSGYQGPILFRSPYGKKFVSLPFYLWKHDRQNVFWDVQPDSDTSVAPASEAIVKDVLEKTKPGSIVLLHLMYSSRESSRRALPLIIRELKRRGYSFVTVSELLKRRDV